MAAVKLRPDMLPVLEAFSQGKLTKAQSAKLLGVGLTTQTRLRKEAGLPSPPIPRRQLTELDILAMEAYQNRAISAEAVSLYMGDTRANAKALIWKYGYSRAEKNDYRQKVSPDLIHTVLDKVRSGCIGSYTAASKELGVKDSTAKKILLEHGLEIKNLRKLEYYPNVREGIHFYRTWKLRTVEDFMAFVGCGRGVADRLLKDAGAKRGQGTYSSFMKNPEAFIAAAEFSEMMCPTSLPRIESHYGRPGPKPRVCKHPDFELAMQMYAFGEISSYGVGAMLGCTSTTATRYLSDRGILRSIKEARQAKQKVVLTKLRSPEILALTSELIKIGERYSTGGPNG